ncbi:MAG: hypothetical protein AAF235_08300 [Planctomycetota bacterium]
MEARRLFTLSMLICVAGAWSAVLAASGVWLAVIGASVWPGAASLCTIGGITLIAAGHLVFLVCVADRCFPIAGRTIGPWVEFPLSLILIAGCIWIAADVARYLAIGAA